MATNREAKQKFVQYMNLSYQQDKYKMNFGNQMYRSNFDGLLILFSQKNLGQKNICVKVFGQKKIWVEKLKLKNNQVRKKTYVRN